MQDRITIPVPRHFKSAKNLLASERQKILKWWIARNLRTYQAHISFQVKYPWWRNIAGFIFINHPSISRPLDGSSNRGAVTTQLPSTWQMFNDIKFYIDTAFKTFWTLLTDMQCGSSIPVGEWGIHRCRSDWGNSTLPSPLSEEGKVFPGAVVSAPPLLYT